MAAFSLRALARIQSAEDDEDPFDKRSFIPSDETPRQRGQRQLALANEVITEFLEGELLLTAQLGEIAGRFLIDAIEVLPAQGPGRFLDGRTDQLLDPQRRNGIKKFLQAWGEAVDATRQALEAGGDD
jgi:hypothetical protein